MEERSRTEQEPTVILVASLNQFSARLGTNSIRSRFCPNCRRECTQQVHPIGKFPKVEPPKFSSPESSAREKKRADQGDLLKLQPAKIGTGQRELKGGGIFQRFRGCVP